jgi:hypothetical protein
MGAGECRPDPEAQGIPFHYYVVAGALVGVAILGGVVWMQFQKMQARNEVKKYEAAEGADEAEEEEGEIEEVGEEDEASRVEKALKNKIKKSKRKNQK